MPNAYHHNICIYCKLQHSRVEAGGLWFCPNVLCPGPGATYWRSQLKSYRDNEDGTYSVDSREVLDKARALTYDEPDAAIKEAIISSMDKWAAQRLAGINLAV